MTFPDLAVLKAAVEAQKARGETPTIAGALREMGPGTLAVALEAEGGGEGHVEFVRGAARWVSGPQRFRP